MYFEILLMMIKEKYFMIKQYQKNHLLQALSIETQHRLAHF